MHRNERLRLIFKEMDNKLYNDIRNNYYKAAEGIARLNELLAEASKSHKGLTTEAAKAGSVRSAFGALDLGDVL